MLGKAGTTFFVWVWGKHEMRAVWMEWEGTRGRWWVSAQGWFKFGLSVHRFVFCFTLIQTLCSFGPGTLHMVSSPERGSRREVSSICNTESYADVLGPVLPVSSCWRQWVRGEVTAEYTHSQCVTRWANDSYVRMELNSSFSDEFDCVTFSHYELGMFCVTVDRANDDSSLFIDSVSIQAMQIRQCRQHSVTCKGPWHSLLDSNATKYM